MSTLFQPTALVGAIALAMGFSTSVFAAESQDQRVVNAALDTLVVTATRSEEKLVMCLRGLILLSQKFWNSRQLLNYLICL